VNLSKQAELVMKFANSVDVDENTDELDTPAGFGEWLVSAGLLDRHPEVTRHDHTLALTFRAGIREALGASDGTAPDLEAVSSANAALRELPLQVSIGVPTAGGPRHAAPLTAAAGSHPVRHALASIAIAWAELVTTGDSVRLKRCPDSSCAWVFWDRTKNLSRRWCSMRACGNLAKTRAYAARQRGR
jgi:predicted RNA-binding Zn ribbon-like protein